MAVIANNNQKGQNALNPLQTIGTAAPAGQGQQAPNTPAQNNQAPAAQQQQGSGRFTNLQKYLQANQAGGQRIASNIQDKFNKDAQGVQQGIAGAGTQLQNKVNPLNTQLVQGQQQLRQGFQDPNAVLADQQKLQDFRNLQQGYGQNITNVQNTEAMRQQQLGQQLQQLQGTANLAGSEQGRFQLLRDKLGGANYSQGAQRLDQVLLQSQPNVSSNLQAGLQGVTKEGQQNLSAVEQERIRQINSLKGLSNQRKDEWENLLSTGISGDEIDQDINSRGLADIYVNSQQRLADAQTDMSQLPELRKRLAENKLNSRDVERLGLQAGTQLYDVDPNQFMSQTDYVPDITNTANVDEVKRYNALRKLADQDQLGGGMFGDESQAGTYKSFNYNKDEFDKATAAAKKKYEVDRVKDFYNQLAGTVKAPTIGQDIDPTKFLTPGTAALAGNQLLTGTPMQAYTSGAANVYQAALPGLLNGLTGDRFNYDNLYQAANQAMSGSGGIERVAGAATQGGSYDMARNMVAYKKELADKRARLLNSEIAPIVAAAPTAPIDWAKIKSEMAKKV